MNGSTAGSHPMMKPRERTMTGDTFSSIGSFATYFSHDDESSNKAVDEGQVMPVTPVVSDMMDQEEEDVPCKSSEQVAAEALDALQQVMEGIRIITRQMKHSHDVFQAKEEGSLDNTENIQRERSRSDSCSTIQSCASDDDRRLSVLSRQLDGTLGADLMGLAHAAQMVGENSRLASQEASQSVRDVHDAQKSIDNAEKRATKAESAVRIMYKKQKELIGQLEKTRNERNVLKRQVKALLKEKAVMKEQEHAVRALELHVVGALQAHETQLALQQAKRREENKNNDSDNVATVRLECPSQDDDHVEPPKATSDARVHEEHFAPTKKPTETKSKSIFDAAQDVKEPKSKSIFEAAQETKEPKSKSIFEAAQEVKEPKSKSIFEAAQETEDTFGGFSTFFGAAQETKDEKTAAKPVRGSLGFGGALGFGGSFRRLRQQQTDGPDAKQPSAKKEETKNQEKGVETSEEKVQEPALISPTNSVEESSTEDSNEQSVSKTTDEKKDDSLQGDSSGSIETSITTDGISPCNQASLITPSPAENSASTKGFFHRSKKEPRRAAVGAKKPLLKLDDASVDATEGSHEFTFTSETLPSESSSAASVLSCDVGLNPVPPSLSCDTTGQVSPFAHEFAADTPTDVLDDKAFRSLALPSFVGPKKETKSEIASLDSPTLPPELAEIAEIYAELGQLHEC